MLDRPYESSLRANLRASFTQERESKINRGKKAAAGLRNAEPVG